MMALGADNVIWIVQRRIIEAYEPPTIRVVTWHRTQAGAKEMAERLQIEFEQAREEAWPGHEAVDTIFTMLEELESDLYVRKTDTCTFTREEPTEQTEAMLEQLAQWWIQELRAWETFVEEKVISKMSDRPGSYRELVDTNETIRYEYLAVSRDPAGARNEGPS